jgi:hypothetical protein
MVENFLEDDFILTRMKFDDITASRACNLLYKFLIRVYCGPFLGKCIRMELPDCCLKGVWSLVSLKNKEPNKVYTGFKPVFKCSKSSSDYFILFF